MEDKKLLKRKYKIRSKKQKYSRKRTQKKNKRSLKRRKNTNRRTRRRNTRRNIHGGRNPFLKRLRKEVKQKQKKEVKQKQKKEDLKTRQERRRQWRAAHRVERDDLGLGSNPNLIFERRKALNKEQDALVKAMDVMETKKKESAIL